MRSLFTTTLRMYPTINYIGDPETGIVHTADSNCFIEDGEVFLDVRTALVRGYRYCRVCTQPGGRSAQTIETRVNQPQVVEIR